MGHTLIKLNDAEWLIMRETIHTAIETTKTKLDYYKTQSIVDLKYMRFNLGMAENLAKTLKNLEHLKKKTEKFERMEGDELWTKKLV